MAESPKQVNGISLLRIVAVCMILTVHFGQSLPFPAFLHTLIAWCQHGVQLFFLISGFLIFKSLRNDSSTKNFYRKRVLRILPSYWTIIVLNIILFGVILHTMPKDELHLGWWRYFLFLQTFLPTSNIEAWNNLSALWTMSAFGMFYLLAPVFYRLMNTYKKACMTIFFAIGISVTFTKVMHICAERSVYQESLNYLAGKSPIAVFWIFLVGGLIYQTSEEKWGGVLPSFGRNLVFNIWIYGNNNCSSSFTDFANDRVKGFCV